MTPKKKVLVTPAGPGGEITISERRRGPSPSPPHGRREGGGGGWREVGMGRGWGVYLSNTWKLSSSLRACPPSRLSSDFKCSYCDCPLDMWRLGVFRMCSSHSGIFYKDTLCVATVSSSDFCGDLFFCSLIFGVKIAFEIGFRKFPTARQCLVD